MYKTFPLLFFIFSMPCYASECVILLHGLARSSSSMSKVENRFTDEGYVVANVDYPSRKYEIDKLAKMAVSKGLEECSKSNPKKIHFITHSLGGILVRQYLENNKISNLGRTVMLGPPNKGSEVVDKLRNVPGFKFINGPAGLQLGTGSENVPESLGPADFEVGIISGTRSINLILSMLIPSIDDGKVSLERAHLENEKEFLEMPVSHPFIMDNSEVIENIVHFIKYGVFLEADP